MKVRALKPKLTNQQEQAVIAAVRRMRDVTGCCYEMDQDALMEVEGCIYDIEAIIYAKPKGKKK